MDNNDNVVANKNDLLPNDGGTQERRSSIKLKRQIGLFSATNIILCVMIGSGVFVSTSSAMEYSGSVALCLIIWIVSGIISLLGALSFAELGTVIPRSGGEYVYLQEAFGKMHKFWGPLPAFLCAFIYIVISRPAEVAIIVMTCAEYAIHPFTSDLDPEWKHYAITLASFTILMSITYINMTSVKLYVKVQNVCGMCGLGACLLIIGGGVYEMAKGNTAKLQRGFEGSTTSPGGVALALYSGLWAYDGWNSVTIICEEVIDPGVNVPLSILIAVPLVTALYTLMNTAYMSVFTYDEMISLPAVAVTFGERVIGAWTVLVIPIGVAISCYGCAMSTQFGVTRVCYTAAQNGHMMELFSYVNIKRLTPAPAVAFQGFLTIILITVGDVKTLVEFASWFLWFFYGLSMVALLVLRRTQPDKKRPYRVYTVVPCFVVLVAIFLCVTPIVHDPSWKFIIAIGLVIIGVGVYTLFVYHKKVPTAIIKKLTFVVQMLFLSVPPDLRRNSSD